MIRLIKTTLLPALLLAGFAVADTPSAEAVGPFGGLRGRRAARTTHVHHHVTPVTHIAPLRVAYRVPVVTSPVVTHVVQPAVITHRVSYPVVVPTYYDSYFISY